MERGKKRKQTRKRAQKQFSYSGLDEFKLASQQAVLSTLSNVEPFGVQIDLASIGESAQVFSVGDLTMAMVLEGLGTEPDAIQKRKGQPTNAKHWRAVGRSSIAVIANDMGTVAAQPIIYLAYNPVNSGEYYNDRVRARAIIEGRKQGVDTCRCAWVGGESPGLNCIIQKGTIDLAGAMLGICPEGPLRENIQAGDRIVLLGSSGPHDNGFTDFRNLAATLPRGYKTNVVPGLTYEDALLEPTVIYVPFMRVLANRRIPVNYAINVTGHALRKVMRAEQDFSYVIEHLLPPQPVFPFIQEHAGYSDRQMYGSYNMGIGFVLIAPKDSVPVILEVARSYNIPALDGGYVERGRRSVHLLPVDVHFKKEDMSIRLAA